MLLAASARKVAGPGTAARPHRLFAMANNLPHTATTPEDSGHMATPDGDRTRTEVRQGNSRHMNLRVLAWGIVAVAIGFVLLFVALAMGDDDQQRAVDKAIVGGQMTTDTPPTGPLAPAGQNRPDRQQGAPAQ